MKILHVTKLGAESLLQNRSIPGDFGGGVAAMIRDVSRFMEKQYGHQSIVTSCYKTEFVAWAQEHQLRTHIVPSKWVSFLKRPMFVYFSVNDIVALIKKEQIDVVHAHHFNAALWGGIAAKKAGIPMVFALHQDVADYRSYSKNPAVRLLNFLRRWIMFCLWSIPYRMAVCIMPVSQYVAKSAQLNGFRGGNVKVVYNGIDTDYFKPGMPDVSIRKELGFSDEHILIGTTSRLDKNKGYVEAIQAAVAVKQQVPVARFVFVGDGPEKQEYLDLAYELGVDDIIVFPGFRSNIKDVLQDLDIWLFPTYHVEGFSISLLEAQAVGLPCVVSDMGGNPECVIDGVTGMLIPPKSVKELADAVIKLCQDPDSAKRLGVNARERAVRDFSIEKQAEDLFQIYQDACGSVRQRK
jgi:glycosyltransferase involved in cell wall biosynthesis